MADDVRARVVAVAVAHRRPVGMERLLLERALHVDDRLERLVLDDDRLERPCGLLRMLGGDDRDGLADVAHPIGREHRLVGELEPVDLLARHVGVREHRVHAGERERGREVDRGDPRVWVRAAQRVPPEHPRRGEVARVLEGARHLRHGVVAQDALADPADGEPRRRRRDAHRRSAASRTASKILT